MKTTIVIAAGLVSLGIVGATPAAAFHLSPPGDFSADGTTSATKNGITLPCKAHFDGTVNADGVGAVTGGQFTDNGAQGCTLVSLQNLPWEVDATGKKNVLIKNVTFSTPIGSCGPGDVVGKIKNGHLTLVNVSLPPDCQVSADVITTPTVKIKRN
ncbi:MAG: hypothetical protein JOY77_10095 [Alphaproteobacteria bacterium]|nr:hypothetical protein [Alphaproteobacteria bacterium]MBV9063259.1 hypothetical protein [Alphaproteobacteria bacterium]